MLNKLRKSLETLVAGNDRDLLKGLIVCKLETQLGKKLGVFQKKGKEKKKS